MFKPYIAKLITFWWTSIIILKFNNVNHKHINWNIKYEYKMFLKICVKTFYIFQHVMQPANTVSYYMISLLYYYLSKCGNWNYLFHLWIEQIQLRRLVWSMKGHMTSHWQKKATRTIDVIKYHLCSNILKVIHNSSLSERYFI